MKKHLTAIIVLLLLVFLISSSSASNYSFNQIVDLINSVTVNGEALLANDHLSFSASDNARGATLWWNAQEDYFHFQLRDNDSNHIRVWDEINRNNIPLIFSMVGGYLIDYLDFDQGAYIEAFVKNTDGSSCWVLYSPKLDLVSESIRSIIKGYDDWNTFIDTVQLSFPVTSKNNDQAIKQSQNSNSVYEQDSFTDETGNLKTTSIVIPENAFKLHSNVTFGMTREDVLKAENNAGFSDCIITKENKRQYFVNCRSIHDSTYVEVSGQIAGIKGASIFYHFNNNSLNSALYLLYTGWKPSSSYNILREALVSKYGQPDTEISEIWHKYLKLDAYSEIDYYIDIFKADIDYQYNDSWLIPQEDGSCVLITGLYYKTIVKSQNASFYSIYIGYQQFDQKMIEDILRKYTEDVDTIKNQLENDL